MTVSKNRKNETKGCLVVWACQPGQTCTYQAEPLIIKQKSKLNTIEIRETYKIFYKAEKVGTDSFVIVRPWKNNTNKSMTATITYNVKVVENPL